MTTTLQAHGGGAQPASIDTSGKVAGGAAQRVYGFDSVEAAQTAGYVCEGGPAMSVALITDAQIASGAWKAEGDPSALVVYTAPDGMPVEGGYAVPVYPVNGWGSAPAPSDPIGDALRADCVAYWKMDEASGARSDSTSHAHTLSEAFGSVASVSGLVGNAIEINSDPDNTNPDLFNSGTYNLQNCSIRLWFRIPVPTSGLGTEIYQNVAIMVGTTDDTGYVEVRQNGHATSEQLEVACYTYKSAGEAYIETLVNRSAWHFVRVDRLNGTMYIALDDGLTTSTPVGNGVFDTDVYIGVGLQRLFTLYIDEVSIFSRALTIDEDAYLYNGGAGRTLYP